MYVMTLVSVRPRYMLWERKPLLSPLCYWVFFVLHWAGIWVSILVLVSSSSFFFLLEAFNWYVIGFQNLYTFVLLYIKKSEIKRSTLLIWLFHQKNVVLASYNSLSSTFMKFLWVNWTTKRRKKMWIFKCVRNFFELWLQK